MGHLDQAQAAALAARATQPVIVRFKDQVAGLESSPTQSAARKAVRAVRHRPTTGLAGSRHLPGKDMIRGQLITAAAAGLALVAGLVGCSSGPPASALKLMGYHGSTAGAAIPGVDRDKPFFFATFQLCATHGPVTPTSVTLNSPTGGLSIVDWGVSTQLSGFGAEEGTVASLPSYTHGPVSYPCTGAGPAAELDVSVRSAQSVASASSLTVTWKHGTVHVPFAVMICTAKCPDPDQPSS